jgi:hypothetical protein
VSNSWALFETPSSSDGLIASETYQNIAKSSPPFSPHTKRLKFQKWQTEQTISSRFSKCSALMGNLISNGFD